ncbi:MAG: ABC transporter substrate-binding protein [Verrucomicrobia bacterium]|nr:MAG: ABC transporter substrate-binding protein [Verrucomicrobiota bacterium]
MGKYLRLAVCVLIALGIAAFAVSDGGAQKGELQNGVWRAEYGKPAQFDLLDAVQFTPDKAGLDRLPKAELPIKIDDVAFQLQDGKVYLRFPLERDEQIYGLGLNFKKVNQRGTIRTLRMDIYHGRDDGRTHAPIPFFISSRGYGVFINSARKIDVYCGTTQLKDSPNASPERDRATDPKWEARPYSDCLEILVPQSGVEVYYFAGKDVADVVRRYNLYFGGGAMPARWGLGFWHRVPLKFTDKDALREADELIAKGFPFSVLGLEPGWQSNSYPCTYDWDKERFPEPAGLIGELRKRGIEANLWMNGYVSKKSSIYDKLKDFYADHTVWCGAVPDYSMPQVREIFIDAFKKNHLDIGVGGFKLDENDGNDFWLYPDTTIFPSGISGEQFRQTHAVFMARMINDLYERNNRRTFSLVRGTNAGTNAYPFVLYSDYGNHKDILTAAVNSSFIGTLWTPEACNARNADEWSKRIQSVAWSPLAMLNAWASKKKPWSFPEAEKDVRETFQLRARMVPYLYNAFYKYHKEGVPPLRAMVLEESFSGLLKNGGAKLSDEYKKLAEDVSDQWMLGDDILVAPMLGGQSSRKVLLPAGKWFDFYTGKYAGSAEVVSVDFAANGNRIPVYVRDGAIIPMSAAPDLKCRKLVLRHYGNLPGKLNLYDDDGVTFDYKKGNFAILPAEVDVSPDGKKTGKVGPELKNLFNYDEAEFEFMTK